MRDLTRFGPLVIFLQLLLGQIVAPAGRAGTIDAQLTTAEKQQLQREARLVVDLLQNNHYSGRTFREIDNKTMIARFLEELDPQADIFSAESVELIHRRFDRTFKSVYLFRGDLQPAFEIFDQFITQARQRMDWAQKRLDRGFDLTLDETYEEALKPVPFKTTAEADRHWELLLKEWVVGECLRGRTPEDAVAEVKKRYAEFDRTVSTFDSLSVRERFFDSIIRSYDPHSGYFSADSAREFALEMEKAVVGLGLDLKKESGRCVVAAVQAGGSADLNSAIAPGDIIEALAEGDGPWVQLAGLRLREIVNLMRGPAGAKIRVAYRPGGVEALAEISLERSRIVLGADRAHGAVSELAGTTGSPRRIGWISLPSFYTAGENGSLTSVARDVRELIQQMTATRLDGLVMDLRNNPGGALNEAAALSELFLPRGIMMLSRGLDGNLKEHPLKEGEPLYNGPLVVLTSALSASASEVFAGAMKYHRRAVIAGAVSTFGKGTMQNYIEVSRMQGNETNDWGTLRLTTERFYLPNGQSVQRTGIPADIIFPELEAPGRNRREADQPGAFPEETVPPPAGVTPAITGAFAVSDLLLTQLNQAVTLDFKDLPEWNLFRQEQELRRHSIARENRSLILESRRKEWTEQRTAWEAARRTRREITERVRYPTQCYDIGTVLAARQTHQTKLRKENTGEHPLLQRLNQGSYMVETDDGNLRKLRLDMIDFQTFSGDTEVLALAFSNGAGHPASAADMGIFLREISLLEHKTDTTVLATARRISSGTLDEDAVRRGTESLLRRLTELNGDMLRELPGLDIPLRESLRIAAAWAERPTSSKLEIHQPEHP